MMTTVSDLVYILKMIGPEGTLFDDDDDNDDNDDDDDDDEFRNLEPRRASSRLKSPNTFALKATTE